jgi:hypothetical protein
MTDEAPLQMILGVFASPHRASAMRLKLRESEQLGLIDIVNLVIIERDRDGPLDLVEGGDTSNGVHDRGGSFFVILRLLLGPTPDESSAARLSGLAEALPPGSSAIAALIEHRWVQGVRAALEEAGADTVTAVLKSEIATALGEGRDVVLTAGAVEWGPGPLQHLRGLVDHHAPDSA